MGRSLLVLTILVGSSTVRPCGGAAQDTTAVVTGSVFDSTEMRPLAGARVAIMGTSLMGDSDAEGRFRFEAVPQGSFWVSFFHPRLQALGVSPPSRQLTFTAGALATVDLAIPSERSLVQGWCLAEQQGGGAQGAVTGTVRDSLTGVPMPSAVVTVGIVGGPLSGGPEPVEVRADDAGNYRICNAPAGVPLRLQAQFGASRGVSQNLTVSSGSVEVRDLSLVMSTTGTLSGQVLDYSTGAPLAGASVRILGTSSQRVTDEGGMFHMDDLPPGRHLVTTDYLGYEQRTDSITIFSAETVGIEVRMATAALEVEGLVVTARSRFGRSTLATGKRENVITRADIEPLLVRSSNAGHLLRNMNVPGLSIREVYVADPSGVVVPGLCVEVSRRFSGTGCNQAQVYIDGLHVPYPDQILNSMDPNTIDRIEILGASDAQFQLGAEAANGAVLIYTSR
ncbi:MAG: carboxypeptidase regulatory-like domain-containing protein [Gemmatimonadota bacterium]|nr:carboxypeptidase regulatory-like domain-containing protein [Gemmatimonadota bacterium]